MKFKNTCCTIVSETFGSKFMKGVSCCAIVFATFEEIFLFFGRNFGELSVAPISSVLAE